MKMIFAASLLIFSFSAFISGYAQAASSLACDGHQIQVGGAGANGTLFIDGLPNDEVTSVQWQPTGATSAAPLFSSTGFCGVPLNAGDKCALTDQSMSKGSSYVITCNDDAAPHDTDSSSGYIVMSVLLNGRFGCDYIDNQGHLLHYVIEYSNCRSK